MQGGVLLLPLLPPCRPSLHGALVGIEAVIARCPCGDRGRPGMPSWSPARARRIIMASCSCRGRARGRGGARKLAVTLSRCQCMRGATRAPGGQKKASVLLTAFVDCNWHTKTALARAVLKSTPSPASPAENHWVCLRIAHLAPPVFVGGFALVAPLRWRDHPRRGDDLLQAHTGAHVARGGRTTTQAHAAATSWLTRAAVAAERPRYCAMRLAFPRRMHAGCNQFLCTWAGLSHLCFGLAPPRWRPCRLGHGGGSGRGRGRRAAGGSAPGAHRHEEYATPAHHESGPLCARATLAAHSPLGKARRKRRGEGARTFRHGGCFWEKGTVPHGE